jgi:UDP-N-acetyl-D-glucosamine dehydrogenase
MDTTVVNSFDLPEDKTDRLHSLLTKIKNRDFTIGVLGLGYVGLPVLWTFHNNNMPVLGFDIDQDKINCPHEGHPYIKHLGQEMMQQLAIPYPD